jgi:hypothetical protein
MAGLAAGSGAIASTGAFSQVGAQRSVTVATAGDAGANLAIEPFAGSQNSSYVDDSGDTVGINLDDINQNAITNIDKLLQVTNNGTEEIAVGFDNQYSLQDGNIDNLPGGWGYAVNNAKTAAVVLWMSPLPSNISKSPDDLRPGLSITGFGGTELVSGNGIDDEVGKIDHDPGRTIDPDTQLHVGAIVDTRDDTIDTINEYTSSSYVESPYTEVTFLAERTN